jgi:hypothetical protein
LLKKYIYGHITKSRALSHVEDCDFLLYKSEKRIGFIMEGFWHAKMGEAACSKRANYVYFGLRKGRRIGFLGF